MATLPDILKILHSERERLFAKHALKSMAVFGSHAREEARPDSDVDIRVEFDTTKDYDFHELAYGLNKIRVFIIFSI